MSASGCVHVTKQQASALVVGYIHEYEKSFQHYVPSSLIPKILDFYPIFDAFKWQKGGDADDTLIIFDNGSQVINYTDANRLCIANHVISSRQCQEYFFEIELVDFDFEQNYSGIMLGIVNASNTNNASPDNSVESTTIKSFNSDFSACNRDVAWSIYLSDGHQFFVYGPNTRCQKLTDPIYDFRAGDRIKVLLNMITKTAYLYYNDQFICIAFTFKDWKAVVPGLALWDSHVAVSDWSVVDNNTPSHVTYT